jgi:hypothetical protein
MSISEFITYSLLFATIHLVCYVVAGLVDLQLAKHLYMGKDRLYRSFFRDMRDVQESRRVGRLLIPSQLLRGLIMSVVLYPVLPYLHELSFVLRFGFLAGLMFVYADFASAVPFSNTIEGLVYLRKEFVERRVFWTILFESILYSVLFGALTAWLLF